MFFFILVSEVDHDFQRLINDFVTRLAVSVQADKLITVSQKNYCSFRFTSFSVYNLVSCWIWIAQLSIGGQRLLNGGPEINIEGTLPIEYVRPRRIFRQTEIMVGCKTLTQGVIVLRKMLGKQILKIIIIKIIATSPHKNNNL